MVRYGQKIEIPDYVILPYEPGRETVRNRIAEWRIARGLSQEQLAELVIPKTTSVSISRLENGHTGLSQKWLEALAKALEVHMSELLPPNNSDTETKQSASQETIPFFPPKDHWLNNVKLRDSKFFTIQSDALSSVNIDKNSIIIADFSADAIDAALTSKTPSFVLVNIHYDRSNHNNCCIVPRQFIPPHTAIRNSTDRRIDPVVIDDELYEIIAVITDVIRPTQ